MRKPHNTTAKRRLIEKLRPALSYQYWEKNRKCDDIAKDFGFHKATVRNSVNCYRRKEVSNLYGGRESLIIVPKKNLGESLNVLREMGIDARFPSVNHTLEERYESKINIE